MICSKCGGPLVPGNAFCTRCGTPIAGVAPPTPTPATPGPGASPSPTDTRPVRRKRRWGRWLGVFFLLLVVLGGAGYVAVSTGYISVFQIARWLEPTPGEIALVNLTDADLRARIVRLDTESGEEAAAGSKNLEPMMIDGLAGLEPGGRYRLEIQGSARASGQCLLRIERGDVYRVVAVPEGIALTREGHEAASAAELRMETSPLCSS